MLGGMMLVVLQRQGRELPKYQQAQKGHDKCRTPSANLPQRHLQTSIAWYHML